MAEGVERDETGTTNTGIEITSNSSSVSFAKRKTGSISKRSMSLSSDESLSLEETLEEEDEAVALGRVSKKCPAGSPGVGKERSKTPPPGSSNSKASQRFKEFLLGDQEEDKSRDSGVHLDCPPKGQQIHENELEEEAGSNTENRRHSKSSSLPHGVKLCPETNTGDRDAEKCASLEEELRKAQSVLKERDAEVEILKGIRQQVEGELEDLTASLFQEAHKMVTEAKMKEVASEKSLTEARMQLEGLQAEVAALKALLITSTPSRPNLGNSNGISLFKKQHKRTPSHNHLQYGRNSDEESNGTEKPKQPSEVVIDRSCCDVDPILLAHFAAWRLDPTLSRQKSDFLQKIYAEDIDPCLSFADDDLVARLRKAIEDNSVWVEPLPEKDRNNVPKECALLKCPRVCHYRMRFAFDTEEWYDISKICRDRIAAVCEFLNYLRYTKNGLVKASVDDAYWEMLRLRKQMAIAKLGIYLS